MNKKKALVVILVVILGIITGFAIAYSFLDIRLTENSVRIVQAEEGFFDREIAPFPEDLEIISHEEFIEAMEEEARELTDEEFRRLIETAFNIDNIAAGFITGDNIDDFLAFGGNEGIFKREEISPRIVNILFLGDDARIHQYRGRSDTIILISYNRDTRVISLTSFLRDILVPSGLNSTYWNRINLMHAMGGPGRTINLINHLFSLDIQRYAVVRFSGVFALVDALNGLELNIREEEAVVLNRIFPDFDPVNAGNNILNGRQVLAYSRMREIDNDLVRTQRQRNVLRNILYRVLDTKNIGDLFTIAAFILDNVETNISLDEILTMGLELFSGNRPLVRELRIPVHGSFNHALFHGAYILAIDFEENITALHESVYHSTVGIKIPQFTLPSLDPLEDTPSTEDAPPLGAAPQAELGQNQ